MSVTAIRITDEDDRNSIGEAIGHLNGEAKKRSRRGKIGQLTPEYAADHARINALLTDWEAAPERREKP